MATLYVVSTPIGNLEDISLRAFRILSEVPIVACEDTRKTGLLLKRLENLLSGKTAVSLGRKLSKPKLLSYYEGNELRRIPQLIKLLKEGKDVALVSNAGTPTLSDPGFKLVRECLRQGIKVSPIPGPSALLASLVISGLPTDKFLFLGYLPKKTGKRKKLLSNCALLPRGIRVTVVLYESPHRLMETLLALKACFGEIELVVCRELTKIHEEVRREKISQTINHFKKSRPKGEITLLFSLRGKVV